MSAKTPEVGADDQLMDLLYGELDPQAEAALRAQIAADPAARARLQAWTAVRQAMEALPDPEPDPQVHYEILRAARQAVSETTEKKGFFAWLSTLSFNPAFAGLGLAVLAAGTWLVLNRGFQDGEAPRSAAPTALERAAEAPAGGEREEALKEDKSVDRKQALPKEPQPATRENFALGGMQGGAAPGGVESVVTGALAAAEEKKVDKQGAVAESEPPAPPQAEQAEGEAEAPRLLKNRKKAAPEAAPKGKATVGKGLTDLNFAPPPPDRARGEEERGGAGYTAENKGGKANDLPVAADPEPRQAARVNVPQVPPVQVAPPPAPFPNEPRGDDLDGGDAANEGIKAERDAPAKAAEDFAGTRRAEGGEAGRDKLREESAAQQNPGEGRAAEVTEQPKADTMLDGDFAAEADAPAAGPARERTAVVAPQGGSVVPDPQAAAKAPLARRPADSVKAPAAVAADEFQDSSALPQPLASARAARNRGAHAMAAEAYEAYFRAYPQDDQFFVAALEAAMSYEALGELNKAMNLYRLAARGRDAQVAARAQQRLGALEALRSKDVAPARPALADDEAPVEAAPTETPVNAPPE